MYVRVGPFESGDLEFELYLVKMRILFAMYMGEIN